MLFRILGIFGLLALLLPASAQAEEELKPLWEVGLAGAVGFLPDYPAAAQSHAQGAVLPYFVYRGDFIRAGDKGLLRGRFIHTDRVELDVSLAGSFPVESDHNAAREGMPDLDWLGEVGPRLQVTLARAARDAKIDLELPLRAVFSTDFSSVDFRGFIFAPEIAYQHADFLGWDLNLKLGLSADFASRDLAGYFYDVPATFVAASRPAYSADAGYMGAKLRLRGLVPLGSRWKAFAALQGDFHHGAANDASPLFKRESNVSFGLGAIWSFWQSDKMVRNGDP